MKVLLYAGILIFLVVFACGCTSTVPPQNTGAGAGQTPDLLGNWTGTSAGYIGGEGYTDYGGYSIAMRIDQQKDRIFWGKFIFSNRSGYLGTHDFEGVVGRDGRSLIIVEQGGGYSFGTIVGADEIELIHADDAGPSDIAIDTLKRG